MYEMKKPEITLMYILSRDYEHLYLSYSKKRDSIKNKEFVQIGIKNKTDPNWYRYVIAEIHSENNIVINFVNKTFKNNDWVVKRYEITDLEEDSSYEIYSQIDNFLDYTLNSLISDVFFKLNEKSLFEKSKNINKLSNVEVNYLIDFFKNGIIKNDELDYLEDKIERYFKDYNNLSVKYGSVPVKMFLNIVKKDMDLYLKINLSKYSPYTCIPYNDETYFVEWSNLPKLTIDYTVSPRILLITEDEFSNL